MTPKTRTPSSRPSGSCGRPPGRRIGSQDAEHEPGAFRSGVRNAPETDGGHTA